MNFKSQNENRTGYFLVELAFIRQKSGSTKQIGPARRCLLLADFAVKRGQWMVGWLPLPDLVHDLLLPEEGP